MADPTDVELLLRENKKLEEENAQLRAQNALEIERFRKKMAVERGMCLINEEYSHMRRD